jgi:hypothetical protein
MPRYIINQATYNFGDAVTVPTPPNVEGYTFTGWDKEITTATENKEYTALYSLNVVDEPTKIIIIFRDMNGNIIYQSVYNPDEIITVPTPPNVDGYTFAGWDKEITPATENKEYTALYTKNSTPGNTKCVVVFKDMNGNIIHQSSYD